MERMTMNYLQDLIYRLRAGQSERQIAQDLQISRPTVHKYKEWAEAQGYLNLAEPLPELNTLLQALGEPEAAPTMLSSVLPHQQTVEQLLVQGVEMTAIWQRLKENHDYEGSYSAVRRFVQRLHPPEPEATVRVHSQPGEEMQVDFANTGPLFDPRSGRPRSAYVFVATLCYSRHQYAELVFDQKVATWLALHRRAIESFGGVPQRVVPDNLKAAVQQALIYDPVLGEAYRRQAIHYNFIISPTRPGTPQHKGKVESGVHYVQRNFLAGQEFVDIDVANQRLALWVQNVAGVRKHGTTGQAPLHLFGEYEQAALQPLPAIPFSLLNIKIAKVHPDCHLNLDGSYYSVPYQHIGQQVEVHISQEMVEIYHNFQLIASHVRSTTPGQWQTRLEDYPPAKAAYLIQTPAYCRQIAAEIGPSTTQVVETLLAERPLDRLRAVQAILGLQNSVGPQRLEAACARAIFFGDVRYRCIKNILNAASDRDPLPEALPNPPSAAQPSLFARTGHDFFPPSEEQLPC